MNVVFILSDQHNPFFSGCYGNPITRTPNIDAVAGNGVRFENAYCLSPLCAPTRAAMFAGRYVHEIGVWDNAGPWDGRIPGWSHFFRRNGVLLTTIGKLDFAPGKDHGIEDERLPVHRSSLDIHALFREQEIVPRYGKWRQMQQTRPHENYPEKTSDDRVEEEAVRWLEEDRPKDRPWILNVNFTNPHPGWTVRPDLWEYYDRLVKVEDLPAKYFEDLDRLHPYHRLAALHQTGDLATPEEVRRGHVGYHAACETVDRNVGGVLAALERLGLLGETLVIYASDHGENARAHGHWGKMVMYEDSIRVPFVVMGPGIRPGTVERAPVSQLDIFPTICEAVGMEAPEKFRGISLMPLLYGNPDAPKNGFVMSEYHANGVPAGMFAVRSGKWKFVECVDERPILFDLENDPEELHDLVRERPGDPDVAAVVRRMRKMLYGVCSPEAVDVLAKRDQARLRKELEASGRLVEEMYKRGYEKNPERLLTRPDVMPPEEVLRAYPNNRLRVR